MLQQSRSVAGSVTTRSACESISCSSGSSGNVNETRQPNGTAAVNGVGKFNDINDPRSPRKELGFSHIWLTGVLQQATGTDHAEIGQPADDPDLLKGIAGSPYAIEGLLRRLSRLCRRTQESARGI